MPDSEAPSAAVVSQMTRAMVAFVVLSGLVASMGLRHGRRPRRSRVADCTDGHAIP